MMFWSLNVLKNWKVRIFFFFFSFYGFKHKKGEPPCLYPWVSESLLKGICFNWSCDYFKFSATQFTLMLPLCRRKRMLMTLPWNAQVLFSRLIRIAHESCVHKWVGRTRSTNNFLKFLNITAFIIATLNSHGKLKVTSFLLVFEKTENLWNNKILKTKRDGETAIF